MPIPDDKLVKNINKLIYNFLWDSRERIKRLTLIGQVSKGGIGLVDIETKMKALKATWVPRLLKRKGNCFKLVNELLKKNNIDIDYIIKTSEVKL